MNIDKYGIMLDLGDTLYISSSWAGVTTLVVIYGLYRFVKYYYL